MQALTVVGSVPGREMCPVSRLGHMLGLGLSLGLTPLSSASIVDSLEPQCTSTSTFVLVLVHSLRNPWRISDYVTVGGYKREGKRVDRRMIVTIDNSKVVVVVPPKSRRSIGR